MQLGTKRWLLSPITQWRAVRLASRQQTHLDVSTAWVLVRARRNPAEAQYALIGSALARDPSPGVVYDDWNRLSPEERIRRSTWLARHGKSPFQLLGISNDFLIQAGIKVTDWGPPTEDGTKQ